ncbi:hypothetical protein GCM10027429_07640 [Marivirga atlantica]|uniref:histidine kinase n=1 Tax=Marivirga atlantica TaxID=1548457 RepID=A0A937DJ07_9BACT|nr:HAMP domain-containing histidine kinase [Marivirga atlantica]
MDYKTNQITHLPIEGEEILLDIMRASSVTRTGGNAFSAIIGLSELLKEVVQGSESWILEMDGKNNLLWNKEDQSIKEEVALDGELDAIKTKLFDVVSLEEPFLVNKFQLIFSVSVDTHYYFVGISKGQMFDEQPLSSSVKELVHQRLLELFYLNHTSANVKATANNYSEVINKLPQAIVFKSEAGNTWFNAESSKLFDVGNERLIPNKDFTQQLNKLKDKVINREEVELIGNNMLTTMGAFPSSFGEDWIWKFEKLVLKVIKKPVQINGEKGELWVFDNVSELYYANERLNSLFRTLNVAYDEINANLTEFQTKSTTKSITDLEAEESRIIQQYDDNDILGKVTHDLRTPFAKVYTIVQLLLSDNEENLSDQQVERINLIKQIVADGLQIVKGFLSTGNMVLDDKKYNPEPVGVQNFVNENLVPYELLSAKKNIIFITEVPNDTIKVHVDKTYLKRIVDNLVSNAIKFSPFESQINYKVFKEGDQLIFSVKDNGPGLTDDDKSRLFKKYQQLSAKPIGTDESTGLGLFIVKTMVDKMEGKIWVESEHGKGANFKVAFPIYEG